MKLKSVLVEIIFEDFSHGRKKLTGNDWSNLLKEKKECEKIPGRYQSSYVLKFLPFLADLENICGKKIIQVQRLFSYYSI